MGYFLVKTLITALIIAGISELSRKFSLFAAALASLPLVSILAFVWIYLDSRDAQKLIAMSYDIFWLVIPSLIFFLCFPLLLKQGFGFWLSLLLAILVMGLFYGTALWLLGAVNRAG
jgi:hypothetical protein